MIPQYHDTIFMIPQYTKNTINSISTFNNDKKKILNVNHSLSDNTNFMLDNNISQALTNFANQINKMVVSNGRNS